MQVQAINNQNNKTSFGAKIAPTDSLFVTIS